MVKNIPLNQEDFTVYMGELKNQVDSARELMDNMLVWAKNQMESQVVTADHTRLNDIVGETCQLLDKQASYKEIQLINEVDNSCIAFIDKDMIRVVIRNLLSNAIKFTNSGGFVRIKSVQSNNEHILLEITDNGVGIPAEKQSMVLGNGLFSTYGTANEKGTGLGLKICREFVEKNNGVLSFKSEAGAGTTFSISLPFSKMQILTADSLQKKTGFFPNTKYAS
jgi:signal transduction histidine kinase